MHYVVGFKHKRHYLVFDTTVESAEAVRGFIFVGKTRRKTLKYLQHFYDSPSVPKQQKIRKQDKEYADDKLDRHFPFSED